MAEEITPVDTKGAEVYVRLPEAAPEFLARLKEVLGRHRGSCPVYLYYPGENVVRKAPEGYWVDVTSPVVGILKEMVGEKNIKVAWRRA
uniref:Uncharacterized protein n=1 Tax=Ammonifex degensii TaxID=42838 RepID=A0A7C2EJF5_9THEO